MEEAERCATDDGDDDDYDDDGDSADGDHVPPDPSMWKPGLEDLLYSNVFISNMYANIQKTMGYLLFSTY